MHLLRGGKPQHLAAVVGLEHLIALRRKIDPHCGHDVPLVITNQNPIHAVLPHFLSAQPPAFSLLPLQFTEKRQQKQAGKTERYS